MSFDTGRYMEFNFIYHLLEKLDLIKAGKITLDPWNSFEYSEKEIKEKLEFINFKGHCIELNSRNKVIEFKIFPTKVTGFAELRIICSNQIEEINHYVDILINSFKNDFYMIHVLEMKEIENEEKMRRRLRFFKKKKYDVLSRLFPLHLNSELGINIGLSRLMCFGKNMFQFISKEELLNNKHVYSSYELNNIVVLQLYSQVNHKRNKKYERIVADSLGIKMLEDDFRDKKYMDKYYGQYFLKGFEKYNSYYFYGDYIEKKDESKIYRIL